MREPSWSQIISKGELEQLVQFLINNSRAGGGKPEGPGGEEHDVGVQATERQFSACLTQFSTTCPRASQ
jgi:hypothetical protein